MTEFGWATCSASEEELAAFGDPGRVLALTGEVINANPMSSLTRVCVDRRRYYVKIYEGGGRGLRRHLGRSRVRAEWQNLMFFRSIGVPTARVVAYGEQSGLVGDRKGALVTEEIPDTVDLASMARQAHPLFGDADWVDAVVRRLACHIRTLHEHSFIHNDLKWRNILVEFSRDPEVYIIDCPLGRRLYGPFYRRGVIKDLACLDKVAKSQVSGSVRMRFYRQYLDVDGLARGDKRRVRRILRFFEGRE